MVGAGHARLVGLINVDNMKPFAPDYPRTPEGWIQFPSERGIGLRQDIFPPAVSEHPAKFNIYMLKSIIESFTEPGDTVMDIMAGTGTIMIGALSGRNIICIELEEWYQEIIQMGKENIELTATGWITLLKGDCRDFLPIPVNHIIFSPPYAQILKGKGMDDDKWKTMSYSHKHQDDYSANPRNVGNLNRFIYNQVMGKIYGLCYDSIIPGGTMTVVLKDYMKQGKRVYLSSWLKKVCLGFGFSVFAWYKREAMGSGYQDVWRGKGVTTVDDEDIVVFRK